ncbi:MAG TPA: sulfotransferase [Rhizomicrobium sp.]
MPKLTGTTGGNPVAPDFLATARANLFPPLRNLTLAEAAESLGEGRGDVAEPLLKRFLAKRPNDPDALNLMADVARRAGRLDEAERLLARAVALAPGGTGFRFNYALILRRCDKFVDSLAQLDAILSADPENPLVRERKAAILPLLGRDEETLVLRRELAQEFPEWPDAWLHYGQALRRMGFAEDAIAAWRKALALAPRTVAVYANLADLKTYRFAEPEIAGMEALLADPEIPAPDRARLHFGLGQARGEAMQYARSFEHYARANALLRAQTAFDPGGFMAHRENCEHIFTPEFFRARQGWGCSSRAPIFIVGMPRSGSTLLEQILSSHSMIEGLGELADLDKLVGQKLSETTERPPHEFWISGWFEFRSGLLEEFPRLMERLDANDVRALGRQYAAGARGRQTTSRQFFTDKGLRNFGYTGLIHLMLPAAKIVDVRRHPLDCGWSLFRSHFPGGQPFSERLADIGHHYRNYVGLMRHFEHVLPGRIYRVLYDSLVADPEAELHRLFAYLELPFEDACLCFHENRRAVATISSEQVRTPLYQSGLAQWQPYESWLGPLKAALGPVLDSWSAAPL